jgi:hypothetical protein
MNLKFLESLTTRQKQAIAAVGGIIAIVVVVVLVVVLSGGGSDDDDDLAQASGTPGTASNETTEPPTVGPSPDLTDLANGTPAPPQPSQPRPGDPDYTPPPTGSASGPTMQLTLVSGGTCDGQDCFVGTGSTFMLGVEAVRVPAAGYILMQTYIDFSSYDPTASEDGAGPGSCSDGQDNTAFGDPPDEADRQDSDCTVPNSLTYLPNDDLAAEVVWADAAEDVTVRQALGPGLILHGALTGLIPPLPVSDDTGLMVQVQMRCPAIPVVVPISLLPYGAPAVGATSGSLFVEAPPEGAQQGEQVVPFTSRISLHCE